MPHYVGLDVSQKTTAICIVDEQGRRLWRGVCATDPGAISARMLRHAGVGRSGRERAGPAVEQGSGRDRRACDRLGAGAGGERL